MLTQEDECLFPYGWYIWWESRNWGWMPHYVITFNNIPDKYTCYIIPWWKNRFKKIKADPFQKDNRSILLQKRDIIFFCNGNPSLCVIMICPIASTKLKKKDIIKII